MRKIKEYIKKIIILIMTFYLILVSSLSSFARPYDSACGEYVAKYARDYIEKWKDNSVYSTDGAYVPYPGTDSKGVLHVCCTTGVYAWYKDALGIDLKAYGYSTFGSDNLSLASAHSQYWDEVSLASAQPGDILVSTNSSHVEMSLTHGATEHANSGSTNKAGPLGIHAPYGGESMRAFRIKNVDATPSGALPNEFDDEDEEDYDNDTGFYYYGIPKSGEYAGSSSFSLAKILKWLVNLISQIAEFLMGLLTMAIRIQLIGWTTIFENLVTDTVNNITQEEATGDATGSGKGENTGDATGETTTKNETLKSDTSQKNYYTPSSTELMPEGQNKLTVEKIIYNDVPLLDVNIFNMTEAGGKTIKADGTLGIIRTNIAKWYYIFRKFAIIGLLLVLIYMGIRMAISTVASDKAKYKRMLADWAVSFVIVFCIHYFILMVFEVNDFLVEHIQHNDEGSEIQVYEIARTKAYELKATSGIIGTIMYMTLVVLMVKFMYIYLKRYLTVNILVMIAPIIGISYSIDKIKDSKSQSFTHWMQDFTFMVLLQSVHALIYAYFATQALKLSGESIGGIFFACIVLNFMTKADRIITSVFGMEKSAAVSNIMSPQGITNAFAGLAFAKGALGLTGKALGFGMHVGKETLGLMGDIGGVVLPSRIRYGFNGLYNRTTDKLFGDANFTKRRRTSDTKNVSKIDKKLEAQRKKEKALRRNMRKAAIASGTRTITGVAKGMVGTAMLITNPGVAMGLLASSKKDLKLSRDKYKDTKWYASKRSIPGYIRNKRRFEKKGIVYKIGSSSTKRIYDRTKQQYSSAKKDKEKIMTKMPEMAILLRDASERETMLINTYNDKRDEYIRQMTEGLSGEDLARGAIKAREEFEREYISTVNKVFLATDAARSVAREKERTKLTIDETDEVIDRIAQQIVDEKATEARKYLKAEMELAEEEHRYEDLEELQREYDNIETELKAMFEEVKAAVKDDLIKDDEITEGIDVAINKSETLELTNDEKETITKEIKVDLLADVGEGDIETKIQEIARSQGISISSADVKRLANEMTKTAKVKKAKKIEQDDMVKSIESNLEKKGLISKTSEIVGDEIADTLTEVKKANREYNSVFKKNDKDSGSYVSRMYDNVSKSMRDVVNNQPFDVYKEILKKYKKK